MAAPETIARVLRVRRGIRVHGTVQGVGFRPSMYRFARSLGLGGLVRNDEQGVWMEVEGEPQAIERFLSDLRSAAPAQAHIERVEVDDLSAIGQFDFEIDTSVLLDGRVSEPALIPADLAPCGACIAELRDPATRRYRYPFINCTDCGPRFTIIRDLPYDRVKTTMDRFELCEACQLEYRDPGSRRFHAEPNACPRCGPQLSYVSAGMELAQGDAALRRAAADIAQGAIVAVKGVGGFLFSADAWDDRAVAELRRRKRRPHKPFAVLARDLDHVERIAYLDAAARRALESEARPIVLLPLRSSLALSAHVAPGLTEVGVFLAPSPLQQLLVDDGPPLQVMTSGNVAEEPIARENETAVDKLAHIADAFLLHDRPIHTRCDDSVMRMVEGAPMVLRRARGFVPRALPAPATARPVLAVGGHQKSTVCLAYRGRAVLSQHIGDLDHPDALDFFEESIEKLSRLLGVRPELVVHDLHPDYRSTRWARECGLPALGVQHHHAHVAACLAEHAREAPVIGVAFDGTGFGSDGTAWGGEFLVADLGSSERLGHLRQLRLAGGEAAILEPWRVAVAALIDAGEGLTAMARIGEQRLHALQRVLDAGVNTPVASGAGRWFDAVAALCGVRDRITYDGQAAIEFEAAAADVAAPLPAFDFGIDASDAQPFCVDLRPTIREIARDVLQAVPTEILSARFHETLARVVLEGCRAARLRSSLSTVALSGGCFQNRRLLHRARTLLEAADFEVLTHHHVPANDGGLAFGQAAIAAHRLGVGGENG